MNALMAVIQTNIASLNLPISIEFNQTLYGLGLLSSGFFVAYGLLELPGGLLAFRTGAKKLLVIGGLVTSVAALVSAASPSFDVLIVLRFLAGAGLGLSFPPTVVLLIRNIRAGSTGLGASLVATSFSIGGGIGVFGWAVLRHLGLAGEHLPRRRAVSHRYRRRKLAATGRRTANHADPNDVEPEEGHLQQGIHDNLGGLPRRRRREHGRRQLHGLLP
ncbi:MAG: MFS transporter [Nitrososphaerota archaeon]|nr:MFS transporter [Nitrososphaerota archaeon]